MGGVRASALSWLNLRESSRLKIAVRFLEKFPHETHENARKGRGGREFRRKILFLSFFVVPFVNR
jgi:hypothetical protein